MLLIFVFQQCVFYSFIQGKPLDSLGGEIGIQLCAFNTPKLFTVGLKENLVKTLPESS